MFNFKNCPALLFYSGKNNINTIIIFAPFLKFYINILTQIYKKCKVFYKGVLLSKFYANRDRTKKFFIKPAPLYYSLLINITVCF